MIQIESQDGVDAVDAIAYVPGVDCLFVGSVTSRSPYIARPGGAHPDLEAALDRVLAAGRAHGVPVGIPIADVARAADYRRRGVSLFTTSDRGMVFYVMTSFRTS